MARLRIFIMGLALLLPAGQMSQTALAAEMKQGSNPPAFSLKVEQTKQDRPNADELIQVTVWGEHMVDMYAYELDFTFDSRYLKFVKAESAFKGFSVAPILKDEHIKFATTKIGSVPGINGDFALCTLTFRGVVQGNAAVTLTNVKLVDSNTEMVELATTVQAKITLSGIVLKDIAGHWAESYIKQAAQAGFVNGYDDGTFRPDRHVTRAEFVKMLVVALQLSLGKIADLSFVDRSKIPDWAIPYISVAVNRGIVDGYDDHSFRADNRINRSEMTKLIIGASEMEMDLTLVPTFADTREIPNWALPYVAAASQSGFVQGKGNNRFAPNDFATRAEAVKVILALSEAMDK